MYKSSIQQIKVHIIANLINNNTIKVLKQDKGRGIAFMDSPKYMEKCFGI